MGLMGRTARLTFECCSGRHRVTNPAAHDAALRQHDSLSGVVHRAGDRSLDREGTDHVRGGQPWYSGLSVATALTLPGVFRLALCHAEGLIGSIIALIGLDLAVPDYATLSRWAEMLKLPRSQQPHGAGKPMHLLVDSTAAGAVRRG